ncbi:hypothetical protein SLS58_009513 [Diplodia intermedia]|uniref:Uncharacterized protein n=1 Tax=Diplodia intermedia TaxID=856260 RepID=A0ABR3TBS5_9PEZI
MATSPAASAAASPRKWTREEDELLRIEAELQSKDACPSDWKRIAMKIPGRSNKDCRKRWNKICTRINKGAWNGDEDDALRQAVLQHGCRWAQVAQMVRTRNAEQCAKRWHHSLDPAVDRSEWSEEEDTLLLSAMTKYGKSWKTIAEQVFPRRSTTDIKNRYSIITRRRGGGQSRGGAADATTSGSETSSAIPSRESTLSPEDLGPLPSNDSLPHHLDGLAFSLSSPDPMAEDSGSGNAGGYPPAFAGLDDSAMLGLDTTGLDLDAPGEPRGNKSSSRFAAGAAGNVEQYLQMQPDLETLDVLSWDLDSDASYSGTQQHHHQAACNADDSLRWGRGDEDLLGCGARTMPARGDARGGGCGGDAADADANASSGKSLKVTLQLERASSAFVQRMIGMLLESQTQFKIEADNGEPMALF